MLAEELMAKLEDVRAANMNVIGELQPHWSDDIRLDDPVGQLYAGYPHLLASAFLPIDDARLSRFAVAGQLFALSIFDFDAVVDRESNAPAARGEFRLLAAQFEAYGILHDLFPPDAPFWARFRAHLCSYLEGCVVEASFRNGTKNWAEFDSTVGTELAARRAAVAKAVVAGLADLSGDDGPLDALNRSIDEYNIARQYLDDLEDWKVDLARCMPTLVLRNMFDDRPQRPRHADEVRWFERTSRRLFYGGFARSALESAVHHLDLAEEAIDGLEVDAWLGKLLDLKSRAEDMLGDMHDLIEANLARLRNDSRAEVSLPRANSVVERVAGAALSYLLAQHERGFIEARHYMRFPRSMGFHVRKDVQMGEVFQRAIVADALCDARDLMEVDGLAEVIRGEADFLVDQRRTDGIGGWAYFPYLLDLAPDTDDLAQVVQVLLRSGMRGAVDAHAAQSIRVLFDDCMHPDGSVETWIIPSEDRSEVQTWQYDNAVSKWGRGADPEVVANLVYALLQYDAPRFAEWASHVAGYLAAEQKTDGAWHSTWYQGRFYGTYVCLRALAAAGERPEAVARGMEFIRAGVRADGGWGFDGQDSDPLCTSLALLGLAAGREVAGRPDDAALAAGGIEFIADAVEEEQWPKVTFIVMRRVGAAFGSRTLTAAYGLKAALAWETVLAGPVAGRSTGP